MLNFPPPPLPPVDASQLESLAEYYRELAEYYRRASEIASGQLAHVEALLHPNELLAFATDKELDWLKTTETRDLNGNRELASRNSILQLSGTSRQECYQQEETPSSQPDGDCYSKNSSSFLTRIASELESNRGKMLHLDYLVRKLYPALDSDELDSAKEKTRTLLELGIAQHKWFAVPDAPDCWTIDLNEFPDLTEQPTPTKKSFPMRTVLVGSERLQLYATTTEAIAACLQEHYPNSMKTKQIADYFYPNGLSDARRQKVHASLSNALSAENNKLWKRVRVGEYVWKKS